MMYGTIMCINQIKSYLLVYGSLKAGLHNHTKYQCKEDVEFARNGCIYAKPKMFIRCRWN